jgi:hypothetical protein
MRHSIFIVLTFIKSCLVIINKTNGNKLAYHFDGYRRKLENFYILDCRCANLTNFKITLNSILFIIENIMKRIRILYSLFILSSIKTGYALYHHRQNIFVKSQWVIFFICCPRILQGQTKI